MKVSQKLSGSGVEIRQDISEAIRFILFDTGDDNWRYATDGGTAFIVNLNNEIYAITAKHIKGSFEWNQLVITSKKLGEVGDKIATIEAVYYPSDPKEAAKDSDVVDIAIIKLKDSVSFFQGTPYIIDNNTIGPSKKSDKLFVYGSLKDKCNTIGDKIETGFCRLELQDDGLNEHDCTIRRAIAKFDNPEITSVTGISGGPVFNVTQGKLAGMVLRAGVKNQECTLYYVDICDIMAVLWCVHEGKTETRYFKHILTPKMPSKAGKDTVFITPA